MSSVTDNSINEMLEMRLTRSGTPLEKQNVEGGTVANNVKKSVLRQKKRPQTANQISTVTEVIQTENSEVEFSLNTVVTEMVDVRSVRGRRKKSPSREKAINTDSYKEPQLTKATRRLFEQEQEVEDTEPVDSTTRESQLFDYSSYCSEKSSETPVRAYDIYKKAGEYWNVFPKTDFTYSPTSQDRREIAPGVINIPNMSRKGIHSHGRSRSPTRYHTIRTETNSSSSTSRWFSSPTQYVLSSRKQSYWSSLDSDEDEVDTELKSSRLTDKVTTTTTTTRNFFVRYLLVIWTVVTSFYSRVTEGAGQLFSRTPPSTGIHSRHFEAVRERSSFHSSLMSYLSKISDFSAWIVSTETWLLRSLYAYEGGEENVSLVGDRRKSRKLLWLLLIPFLILAGLGLSSGFVESPMKEIETVWESVTEMTENWLRDVNFTVLQAFEKRDDGEVSRLSPPAPQIGDVDVEKLSQIILSSPEFQKLVLSSNERGAKETAELAKQLDSKNLILVQQQEVQVVLSSEVERLRALVDQLSNKFQELENRKLEPHILLDPNTRLCRQKIQDLNSRIKLLQEQQLYLNRQTSNCCKAPPAFPAIEIEQHVTKFLSGLFSSEAEMEHNLPGILTWLQKLFLAKDELESRLANITADVSAKVNKNVIKASKTSANLIMDTVAEQIKQEFMKQKMEMDESWKSQRWEESSIVGESGLSHEEVQRIVESALAKYDADKTGMVDYALESSGGSILSTRCTETYQAKTARFSIMGLLHWYPSGVSHRTVIQPGVHPGNCWAFAGAQGYLVIKLSGLVQLSAFSLEHIPRSLSPTGKIDSAPKDFRVFGLRDEQDDDPLEIGRFRYQENGTSLQYFKIQRTDLPPFNIVELRVESNHGNLDYTCLYRFRVHGIRVTKKLSDE